MARFRCGGDKTGNRCTARIERRRESRSLRLDHRLSGIRSPVRPLEKLKPFVANVIDGARCELRKASHTDCRRLRGGDSARARADDPGPSKGNILVSSDCPHACMKRPVGSGMAKLLRAHLAIPLAVSLTLFAQLFFVHASCPQFPTLASTMNRPGIMVAMVVRLYLDASRPDHDTL